jgi:hypothetical protein
MPPRSSPLPSRKALAVVALSPWPVATIGSSIHSTPFLLGPPSCLCRRALPSRDRRETASSLPLGRERADFTPAIVARSDEYRAQARVAYGVLPTGGTQVPHGERQDAMGTGSVAPGPNPLDSRTTRGKSASAVLSFGGAGSGLVRRVHPDDSGHWAAVELSHAAEPAQRSSCDTHQAVAPAR